MKLGKLMAMMRQSTRLMKSQGAGAATAAIRRALKNNASNASAWKSAVNPTVNQIVRNIHSGARKDELDKLTGFVPELLAGLGVGRAGAPGVQPAHPPDEVDVAGGGRFMQASYTNQAGTRSYKLYIPSGYHGQPLPLVVMLHGCTQNPDDFAAGTGMNAVAEEHQCFVAYPLQPQSANHSKCWNWFNALDQQRDQGEPSLIAGITRDIIDTYHIDPRSVYIAGLSAGGAMAVIMGNTYPELYAAVGIHSGLPYASARDLPSALAAMKNGMPSAAADARLKTIPVIVFHGDRDTTVSPRNGEQIMQQAMPSGEAIVESVEQGQVPHGHAYTRTVHQDDAGQAIAEQWLIHGAGHAWSGGNSHGSYTDEKGPDASREMMRFFTTRSAAMN